MDSCDLIGLLKYFIYKIAKYKMLTISLFSEFHKNYSQLSTIGTNEVDFKFRQQFLLVFLNQILLNKNIATYFIVDDSGEKEIESVFCQ